MATHELRFSRPVWDNESSAWRVTGRLRRGEVQLGVVEGLVGQGEIDYLVKHAPEIAADWKVRIGAALVARWRSATSLAHRWDTPMTCLLTHADLAAVTPEVLRDCETVCTFEG